MSDVENKSGSEEEVSEEEEVPAKEESDSDEEYGSATKKPKKKPAKASPKKRKAGEEDDEDWGKSKKAKTGGRGRGKKNSAFTRSYQLSEELAEIVGGDVMPRHEVVKKLWAFIKENKLQDPKNKQFAICDDQLMKVIGVKKFRTFGMMKYLKNHFIKAV